jgi:hypothetical protein
MAYSESDPQVDRLFWRFNEPVVTREHIRRWLDQFSGEDQAGAFALLEAIEYHSYPRLLQETRVLHAKIQEQLDVDGFDSRMFSDVDFSREFTCKSGDLISYIYRKANAVPSVDFKTFDRLISETADCSGQPCNRALVILDDYTGTGSQFIFQFIARSAADIRVLNRYRKVYLASVVIHDNAFGKLDLLQRGECGTVLSIEEAQFPDYDWKWEENELSDALCRTDWGRIAFLCVQREYPLLSPENPGVPAGRRELIGHFLARYGGDSTLATSFLTGHHAFFYGAPNSLPKILFPLFSRVEDVSIYPTEHFIGVSADTVTWTMEDRHPPDQ